MGAKDQKNNIVATRRDLLKLGALMTAGAVFQFPKLELPLQVPETLPLFISHIEGSFTEGLTNIALGFSKNDQFGEMAHIALIPDFPYSEEQDGRTFLVFKNAIHLSPNETDLNGEIDATPLIPTGSKIDYFPKDETYIAQQFMLAAAITPECYVTASSDHPEYPQQLEKAKQYMIDKFGADIDAGVLVLDEMVMEGVPQTSKRVTLYSSHGDSVRTFWVDKYDADNTIPVDIAYANANPYEPGRGRARVSIKGAIPENVKEKPDFSKMTDEQKLALAPEIDGLTKSNFSTLKNNLLIYRDENGKAQKVYNFLTETELTLIDAGIFEIPLTTGENWEVLGFHTGQEAIDYAATVDGANGTTMDMERNPEMRPYYKKYIYNILEAGATYQSGLPIQSGNNEFAFGIYLYSNSDDNSLIVYMDRQDNFHTLYASENAGMIGNAIMDRKLLSPVSSDGS